ncbi:MAG TPA: pyrrolo-quinoline quinone [Candidatus Dormibacteraeota bacterium]|nr:pyrrolo-quinoline quinone [Candidatus Dormibacteraeota bacterium]
MHRCSRCGSLPLLVAFTLLLATSAASQVNVTTYHNDNSRTGQNTSETVLTTANVNTTTFGKLFTVGVDGQVYAQPLVLSNVSIGGGTHNVVYVATENDSVYALDANSGAQYWRVSLGTPESSSNLPYGHSPCTNITPQYGITATPVIDTTSGTLYAVARNGYYYELHALAVGTGVEKSGFPVTISGSYSGITFDGSQQNIRPGLLLENGHIIFGAGSHCDQGTWYGWVFSYSASTGKQEGIINMEPSGHCAGVWMSGGGLAADSSGNIYLSTGNSEEYLKPDYGDSVVKLTLSPTSGFSVADYFTPSDAYFYGNNGADTDVGSGGVLLLPNTSRLVQMGKPGVLYQINTANMGGYCSGCGGNDTNIVQEIQNASKGLWGSIAYWNGYIYFGSAAEGSYDTMKAFSYNASTGKLSTSPTSTTGTIYWPSPTPSVSSNGTSNGIVWAVDSSSWASSCCATLHAFSATNLGVELYNSNMIPGDQLGGAIKFSVPTIANGKVYVGGNGTNGVAGTLTAYGQIPNRLYCSAVVTCSVQGTYPGQVVAGSVQVTCNESTLLSASATICGSLGGCTTETTPPNTGTGTGAGGASQGSGGSCSLNWSWGGNNYSQFLNP